jgi:hypothetical protein
MVGTMAGVRVPRHLQADQGFKGRASPSTANAGPRPHFGSLGFVSFDNQ